MTPSIGRRFIVASIVFAPIAGCSRDDPKAALEAAVQKLQDDLEAKKTGAVMALLDADFRAQGELDREWAERTMTVMFLRNAKVRIVAVTRSSAITGSGAGRTEAQVVLAGGQGLLPERASPYAVRLEWRRDGKQWKLLRLDWD